MSKKRMVTIGDLHCGHRVGLTPTAWHRSRPGNKYDSIQKEIWDWYKAEIDRLKPIDILVVNGDAIDGKGKRSGSSELITADMNEQVEMAANCIWTVEAEQIVMTYGTPYHTGIDTDHEKQLADMVKATKIGGQEWIDVNGTIFDFKHKIGGTTVPYGKGTPIAKDRLWNLLWTEFEEQPKAQIFIRSHVHYFFYAGEAHWLGMTLPSLQGQGSKFGSRQCVGHVDCGIVWFDIEDDGSFTWDYSLCRASTQKAKPLKL